MENFQLTYNEAAYGSNAALPTFEKINVGDLSLEYGAGSVRYIKVGEVEILRMIYFAVRDHNWDTIPLSITEERIDVNDTNFKILFKGICEQDNIAFSWDCKITGNKDNQLRFNIKGKALTSFKKNRVGFCILHPIAECQGKTCTIAQDSGNKKEAQFPELISPHQPMMDIKEMEWQASNDVVAKLKMEGDVFEMEDQRNWTDDSYKTYCTPLGIPFPVKLEQGAEVEQSILLNVESKKKVGHPVQDKEIRHDFTGDFFPLPKIGVGASSEYEALTAHSIAQLKELTFDHYRIDIDFSDGWPNRLHTAVTTAKQLDTSLLLALFFSEKAVQETAELIKEIGKDKVQVGHIYIFSQHNKTTPFSLIKLVEPLLRKTFTRIDIGAGTNAYFTELNRARVATDKIDMLTYSINPQVHAFDNDSLVETLQAQKYTVESTKAFGKDLPIHISPITLQPRFNPNATGPEPTPKEDELPPQTDVRQMSLFGANWLVGSIKYLSSSHCEQITYFETAGTKGFVQGEKTPKLAEKFRSLAGATFPVYHFLRFLKQIPNAKMAHFQSSDRLKSDAVLLKNDAGMFRGILTNYTAKDIKVILQDKKALASKISHLVVSVEMVSAMMKDKDFVMKKSFSPLTPATNGNFTFEIPAFGAVFIQNS